MVFKDKLAQCVLNFNNIVGKPDYKDRINYYADFVELYALFVKEDGITFGDVRDRFFGVKEYKNSKMKDEDEKFLNKIFDIIKDRIGLFADEYPFEYQNNAKLILKQNLTVKNKLYILLLISSKIYIFNSFQSELTTDFEKVSCAVLKNFLPMRAIVIEFGKNTTYQGNAISKIRQLANDLDLSVNETMLSQISEQNVQERGLDIIGCLPFADQCENKVIFLCQCTCGKEYEFKQQETRRFENYLTFYTIKPQHTLFIPYSLINIRDKNFYHLDLITGTLIFERKRILEYYNGNSFKSLKSFKIVNKIIDNDVYATI
jgi:hypothetical protein